MRGSGAGFYREAMWVFRGFAAVLTVATLVFPVVGAGTAHAEPGSVAVPFGLEKFYGQRLDWTSCRESGLDAAGAECADVTVPLSYAEPDGRTITLAISRVAARDSVQRRGILMSNPGGPGEPGLDFGVRISAALTPAVRNRYDLIGMDPRGMGRSAPIDCRWPSGLLFEAAGVNTVSFAESVFRQGDLAVRCAFAERETLRHITTRNTARDMDVIRGVLGESEINYFGMSYGTYLGSVYSQLFPGRSDRMILDSAIDPQRYGMPAIQDMGAPNEEALDAWADWAAARDGEYRLGTSRSQVRAVVENLVRAAEKQPIRLGEHRIDDHTVPVLIFFMLSDPRGYGELATQVRHLVDAAAGLPVRVEPKLARLLDMIEGRPADLSPMAAVQCGDVEMPRDPGWYLRNVEASRANQPVFGPFVNNITPCAFWPHPVEPPTAVHNSTPALIIQATGDTRTAYAGGVALHESLTASRLVTLRDVRVHGVFGNYPNGCVAAIVETYLRDGALPAQDTACLPD